MIQAVEDIGKLDNVLIIYVSGDNGSSALTNATITSTDVVIALIVENNIALFKRTARRFSRGISVLRYAL